MGSEAPAADSVSASAATNDSRKVSREDIELVRATFSLQLTLLPQVLCCRLPSYCDVTHLLSQVQNLIERCLQLYMNRGEVVRTLSTRARIEPGFTTLGGRSVAFYVHAQIAVIFV